MIAVAELDRIATTRLQDATVLHQAGQHDGAIYLCGYAVEVALKARICRVLNWAEFPSKSGEFAPYRSFQTHNLDVLLRLSGQEARIKQAHFAEWNTVANWNPESRYEIVGTATLTASSDMIAATSTLLGAI